MRLIDADALESKLFHIAFETDTDLQKWDSGCWIRYKLFEDILAEMPMIKNPVAKTEQHKDFEWIPCTLNTKFDEFKECWVTMRNGDVRRLYYRPDSELYPWTSMYGTFGFSNEEIVAYIPIEEPEPYNNTVDGKSVEYTFSREVLSTKPKSGSWRHYEGILTCSECGTEYYDDIMEYTGDKVPKFCPECGAKMW